MYPANWCSGDDHTHEGYVCGNCSKRGEEDNRNPFGTPEWIETKNEQLVMSFDDAHDVNFVPDLPVATPTTVRIDVDAWPEMVKAKTKQQYKVYWEARASHAYPDGVVRIPAQYFVGAHSDGTHYWIIMKRDNEFLSKTRQSYLRAAAAK